MLGRRLAVLLISVLALGAVLAPAASAHKSHGGGTTVYVPPGVSAASQYTEVVPTAGGGSAGSSGLRGGASAIPSAVISTLDKSGSAGKAAANLARTGAPARSTHKLNLKVAPKSATASVSGALFGSAGGGILLPLLLIGSILVASGIGIVRMRRK